MAPWIGGDEVRQRPFILGGHSVIHVDHLAELPLQPIASATIPADVDLPALLEASGFTDEEQAYLLANRVARVPRRQIAAYLGWDVRRVERVARRVNRKLERIVGAEREQRGSSIELSFLAQVRPGAQYWDLEPLGIEFAEIMAAELIKINKTNSTFLFSGCPKAPTLATSSRD